ncbi:MAG: TolC family protein, partial [Myxococcota bacterium]
KGFLEALPDVDKAFIAMLKADNINAVVVPITNDPIASLDAMPDDVDAVYLVSMYHLTADLEQTLLDAIHDRQLPTFAHIGRPGVERGILLGSAPSEALPKIARRTAINVERILLGDKPSSFNVTLVPGPYRLVINLETAHKIGYSPSFSLLAEAEAIGTAVKELPEMTLQQALDKAVASNLELLAAVQDIEANTERVGEARGALLPQLSASVRGTLIDEDRAEAGFGQAPEVAAFVEGEFSQIIYADGLWAQYIGSGYTLDAAKAAQNQLQQDVVEATALAYLNVLRAQTLLRVNTDNLDITRTNLEMAQVRVQIGTATASDVYRWEIELAQDKGEVINARNALSQARIQVNRLLNRNQEFEFTALDVAPGDPILLGSGGSIRRYVNNERDMAIFRNFMVEEGLRTSPELKQLDASILAQERVVLSLRRRLYVPQVALVGDLSLRVLEGGAGTEAAALPEQFGGVSLGGDQDDLNWSLSVVAELPLFAGGTNYAARDAARADLSRLQIDRDNLAIQIEQNVRTRIYDASSTGANIDLSAQAAEASRKNLELTSRAYSQGAITVITLLDAQNTAFVSEQASANAVYDFLIDVVEVERSIGRFQYFGTVAERQAWLQRLDDYFTKAREENRP